mmetsp:Transcript_21606/g.35652  ORF Transcript_21606/g.35652 Transcript_21606/m.35652 type:complete len:304 (-) Transcript_21606:207-1118(-)|eukprot:CAMPEP_0119314224 /NCGR_PEP_ID=MMETSP1333-20130426/32109_1 /TAXON_ID=418940 /ORGANISM="Scyphosphaera apsteinii, Strain RCC1455" /LENGTH=303 /DNA_ID=CAMNT_0007319291 /DNA_START=42 /DNA_END=953 /DNA_ORIENTATION=+
MRILCLHGARSNSVVTKMQMDVLGLEQLGASLDFLDAPFEEAAVDFGQSMVEGRSWHHTYLRGVDSRESDKQLQESLQKVVEYVQEHGPYDGAFGFSQGAAIVTLLSFPHVLRALGCESPIWRFVVLACGVDYLVGTHSDIVDTVSMPSLHLLGQSDALLPESEALTLRYKQPCVLHHPFGHALPLELPEEVPRVYEAIHAFVLKPDFVLTLRNESTVQLDQSGSLLCDAVSTSVSCGAASPASAYDVADSKEEKCKKLLPPSIESKLVSLFLGTSAALRASNAFLPSLLPVVLAIVVFTMES